MQWIKINDGEFINASCIRAVKYDKYAKVYKLTLTNNGALLADIFESVTTFDITDEKEN